MMTEPGRERVDSPKVTGIIERLEGEIALAEEPARFIAALEREEEAANDE
jgi:hypothetical protein